MTKWINLLQNNDFLGVKKYIKAGSDVNAHSEETGESVISCALRYRCDEDIIDLLVENSADLYDFDNEGVSVFDCAITYNNSELVKTIMEKGIDFSNTQRRSGFTPLMAAVCYRREDIVKLLLEQNVDVNVLDAQGLTAHDYARKMNKKAILKLLEA
jgi:ankyrin repeat protein